MKLNEQGLYDIYGIWHKPFWQTSWFYMFCMSFIGVLLLSVMGYVLYRYHKRAHYNTLSPEQRALEQLEYIRYELLSHGKEKLFYDHMLVTIRHYLFEQFGYTVLSCTDEELVTFLVQCKIPDNAYDYIKRICEGSVLIRFANRDALQEQLEHDHERARKFIVLMKTEYDKIQTR